MVWWWPFKEGSKSSEDLGLDPDLQKYYDNIVGKTASSETSSGSRTKEEQNSDVTAGSPQSEIGRVGPTADGFRQKTIKQISMDNCVEYERAYSKCLVKGSYFERFTGCHTELTMYEKCKEMQTQALTVLGYAQAIDDEQRKSIKMKADDLMIQAAPSLQITQEQANTFTKLLESHSSN